MTIQPCLAIFISRLQFTVSTIITLTVDESMAGLIIGGVIGLIIGTSLLGLAIYLSLDYLKTPPEKQNEKQAVTEPAHITRHYAWQFSIDRGKIAQPFSTKVAILQDRYRHYCNLPRNLNPLAYHIYAQDPAPEVRQLAAYFRLQQKQAGYSDYAQVCHVLAFAQQTIRYQHDIASDSNRIVDYPKYPLETLVDKTGDCEDQAALAAAILHCLGFSVAIIISQRHAALGIADVNGLSGASIVHPESGKRYFYAETTAKGWLPGEVPKSFLIDYQTGQFSALPVL
ncbi:MAG: transglutaminase-like domain-containing protein [Chloroflexota bacterium]